MVRHIFVIVRRDHSEDIRTVHDELSNLWRKTRRDDVNSERNRPWAGIWIVWWKGFDPKNPASAADDKELTIILLQRIIDWVKCGHEWRLKALHKPRQCLTPRCMYHVFVDQHRDRCFRLVTLTGANPKITTHSHNPFQRWPKEMS